MRFSMPHLPGEFEIPDEWIDDAGFRGFKPSAPAYRAPPGATLVPLTAVEPTVRFVTHPMDGHGFARARLIRVLMGFVAGDEIEAVPAMELPLYEFCGAPYRYRACNGYHRFYASIAAGFSMLPVRAS
jgi:hypothetical protein